MKKWRNVLLIVAVACLAVHGLAASDKLFVSKQIEEVAKHVTSLYCAGYAGAYVIATNLALFSGLIITPSLKKEGRGSLSRWSVVKEVHNEMYRGITKSALITTPVVFASVVGWHKYQQNLREKKAG